jgi:hypothetical protein
MKCDDHFPECLYIGTHRYLQCKEATAKKYKHFETLWKSKNDGKLQNLSIADKSLYFVVWHSLCEGNVMIIFINMLEVPDSLFDLTRCPEHLVSAHWSNEQNHAPLVMQVVHGLPTLLHLNAQSKHKTKRLGLDGSVIKWELHIEQKLLILSRST